MNLRCKYTIGRSERHVEIGAGKDKVTHTYHTTVVTDHKYYDYDVWKDKVLQQVKVKLETDIFNRLKKYSLDYLAWINTEEEAHKYLQKCSMDNGTNMVETAQMILTLLFDET
mgnify:CR=1 FL=1